MFATLSQQPCNALYPQAWEQGLCLVTRALKDTIPSAWGPVVTVMPKVHAVDSTPVQTQQAERAQGPPRGGGAERRQVGEAQGKASAWRVLPHRLDPVSSPALVQLFRSGDGSFWACLILRSCTWAALCVTLSLHKHSVVEKTLASRFRRLGSRDGGSATFRGSVGFPLGALASSSVKREW